MLSMLPSRLRDFIFRYARILKRWNGALLILAGLVTLLSVAVGSMVGVVIGVGVALAMQVHQFALLELLFEKTELLEFKAATTTRTRDNPLSDLVVPEEQVKPQLQHLIDPLKGKLREMFTHQDTIMPKVTVVVPVFNEERFLEDCLISLQRQTWQNWSCIVVDDCSTDGSLAIAKRFAASDERFVVVQHNINSGLSAARNTGLRLAESDYITFLDSDDVFMKYGLQMRMSLFPAYVDDASLAGVYCGIIQVSEDTPVDFQPKKGDFPRTTQDTVNTQAECPFNAHAPILRTEILRSVGGFREDMLHGAEDWDLWQRIMRAGFYFRSVPRVGGLYRRKRQSMVRSMSTQHVDEAGRIYADAADRFVPTMGTMIVRPFELPAVEYAQVLSFAKRVIQFAGMSYVQGGEDGAREMLAKLPAEAGMYLTRHLNIRTLASAGVERALAVDNEEKKELQLEINAIVERIEDLFIEKFDQLDRDAMASVQFKEPSTYDFLLFVADAYEASLALKFSQSIPEASSVFLVPDAMNGDQGARQVIAEAGGAIWSVNQFVFFSGCVRTVVCFRRAGFGVNDLVQWAEQHGVRTLFINPDISIEPVSGTLDNLADFQLETAVQDAAGLTLLPQDVEYDSAPARQQAFQYSPAILKLEENQIGQPDINRLEELRDKHKGERCVIVGNGPSLNTMDLSLLENEISFAVNGIFYKTEETGYRPTYYVVEDSSVMRENQEAIRNYEVPFKFFPTIYRNMHPEGDNVFFYAMNRGFYEKTGPNFCVPRFSTNFPQRVFVGQSVTYVNLQLAYHMGFSEVYLIGMDFSYVIPESAIREGDIITSTEDDPNHFNGAYFGKGKTWKDPKLDRVLQNYMMAKRMFEADGRVIYNATNGGELEAFERVDFATLFGAQRQVV